jgi:peroxiredoxin
MSHYVKLLTISLITILFVQPANAKVTEGEPAPAFEAMLMNGRNFTLESTKGEVVILHFWATWCPTCLEELPALSDFYNKHKEEGLRVITISMNEDKQDQEVIKYLERYKLDAAFNRNSSFKGYGRVWHLPLTFIIDKKGIIRRNGQSDTTVLNEKILQKTVIPLLEQN